MDLKSLQNVDNVKSLGKGIWNDIVSAFGELKNVNVEKFKDAFDKYVVQYLKTEYMKFDGRVSRRQYWMFALYSSLVGIVLNILILILPSLAILALLYMLAILVPSIGLCIRRLHDINLVGWYILIAIVPFIGGIALLLLLCIPGDAKANDFGAPVK